MVKRSLEGRLEPSASRRTRKFLDGGFNLGRYLGAGVIVSGLLGCDHLPKPVSVSEDGRYIAYSAKENGELQTLRENYKGATMVLYDTKRDRLVDTFEIDGPPIWPTNTEDTVAYMAAPENKAIVHQEKNPWVEVKSSVLIYSKGKVERIKNAAYPELSSDGKYIAFSRSFKPKDTQKAGIHDYFSLILRERETGRERNLNVAGMVPDFSPDNTKIAYVVFTMGNDAEKRKEEIYVETMNLLTGTREKLGDVRFDENFLTLNAHPRWIDNNSVMYTGKGKEGKDSEIFIATLNDRGQKIGITQVTDNNLEETFAERAPDGKVSYWGIDSGKGKGTGFFTATQSVIGWKSKGDQLPILKIAGDKAILGSPGNQIFITPVSNLEKQDDSKFVNISDKVDRRRKVRKVGDKVKNIGDKAGDLGEAIKDLFR